jgi:secreted Zn-dependent insulinase-like peptidase
MDYLDGSKPETDGKIYRAFTLPSGFQVIVVDEPAVGAAKKNAVLALAVGGLAGSFADPAARPGLAHACEHLLFMGSSAFPVENAYDSFLAAHGGSSNAFTDSECTNYQAECVNTRAAVCGTLDRLSAFFVAPTFSEGSVEREVNAVDTEYRRAARDDASRCAQIAYHSSVRGHPFAKFGWGNALSLWGEKTGVEGAACPSRRDVAALIRDLKAFHAATYRAADMALALRADGAALVTAPGESGLDALERTVRTYFEAVPAAPPGCVDAAGAGSASAPAVATGEMEEGVLNVLDTLAALEAHHAGAILPPRPTPFGPPCSPLLLAPPLPAPASARKGGRAAPPSMPFVPRVHFVAPVAASAHRISITWALPPHGGRTWARSGPEHVLSYILGHEARGTLLPALRDAGWALELHAGVGSTGGTDNSTVAATFSLTVEATPAGVAAWRHVVTAVHAYVVHVLCGGINVLDSLEVGAPLALAGAPLASRPLDPCVCPFDAEGGRGRFALLSGGSLPGSTLSALSTHLSGLEWAWAEHAADSLVSFLHGDAPDPWEQVTELASVLARGLASPAEALLTAAAVTGPVPGGPPPGSVLDASRFCPTMAAYLASHLHAGNCRVDVLSSLCGGRRAQGEEGEQDDNVEEEGEEDEEEEEEEGEEGEEEEDDGPTLLPDPRLALAVSIETKSGAPPTKVEGSGLPWEGEPGLDQEEPEGEPADLLTPAEESALLKSVEPFFFAPYAWAHVDESSVGVWAHPPPVGRATGKAAMKALAACPPPLRAVLACLALPPRNPFTPTDLQLHLPAGTASEPVEIQRTSYMLKRGELVVGEEGETSPPSLLVRLFHGPNTTFGSPRSDVRAMVYTPSLYASPAAGAAADVWTALLAEAVNEDVYLASIAGLDGSVATRGRHGLRIEVSGISQHAGALLTRLAGAATASGEEGAGAGRGEEEDADMPTCIALPTKRGRGGGRGAGRSAAAPAASSTTGVVSTSRLSRWSAHMARGYEDALLSPTKHVASLVFAATVEGATPGGAAGSVPAKAAALASLVSGGMEGWADTMRAFLALPIRRGGKGDAAAAPPCLWSFAPGSLPLVVDMCVVGNETHESARAHAETVAAAVLGAARRWLRSLPPASRAALEAGSWNPCPLPAPIVTSGAVPSPYDRGNAAGIAAGLPPAPGLASLYPPSLCALPAPNAHSAQGIPLFRTTAPAVRIAEVAGAVQLVAWSVPDGQDGASLRSRALLHFLAHLVSEPFFDSLRTRQQLGYEVWAGVADAGNSGAGAGSTGQSGGTQGSATGLTLVVESSSHAAEDVEGRMLVFLPEMRAILAAVGTEDLTARLASWAATHAQPHESLSDVAEDAWAELRSGRAAFFASRASREVESLAGLSPVELLAFFDGLMRGPFTVAHVVGAGARAGGEGGASGAGAHPR